MYTICRVNDQNLQLLLHILEEQLGKDPYRQTAFKQKIDRREGLYYLLQEKENILGYVHWKQDPEREAWIYLQKVHILSREKQIEETKLLITTSELSVCLFYGKMFQSAQVMGARFQIAQSNNIMRRMYRQLGYHLIDDEPQELWEKHFKSEEMDDIAHIIDWKRS